MAVLPKIVTDFTDIIYVTETKHIEIKGKNED